MKRQRSTEKTSQQIDRKNPKLGFTSVQMEDIPNSVIVHDPGSRFFLDKVEGGYILLDWEELDPPEGSPGALEIPHEQVMEEMRKLLRSFREKRGGRISVKS